MGINKQTKKNNLNKLLLSTVLATHTMNSLLPAYVTMIQEIAQTTNLTRLQTVGANIINKGVQVADQLVFKTAEASFTPIVSSGSVQNEIVENGRQDVLQDGITIDNTVNVGGRQHISSGGTATGTTLNSDGKQYTSSGGTSLNTLVHAGGEQVISAGGTALNTSLARNGLQVVNTGGIAVDTIVERTAEQYIFGGTALNTTLNRGEQLIFSGGTAISTTVNSAGAQIIMSGGTAVDTVMNSGWQYVSASALALNASLNSGGVQYLRGTAKYTAVNGGIQFVFTGGKAFDTLVNNEGTQIISAGGTALNTAVNSGGLQYTSVGGTAVDTSVNDGGKQIILQGGTAINTKINTGGYMFIEADAKAIGTTTNNGGTLDLLAYNQTNLNLAGANGTVLVASSLSSLGRNVTLESLSGSQTFVINSDLANNNSDKITISGNASGTHYIKIGREATAGNDFNNITEDNKTKVVANAGGAKFKGALSAIDGVNIIPRIVKIGDHWYLVGSKLLGPSKLALTAGSASNMLYAALISTEDNMHHRLSELRSDIRSAGLWLRNYSSEYAVEGSSLKNFNIQAGYDWVRPVASGKTIIGVTIDNQNGSTNYTYGNGKLTNSRIGIYYAWLGNSGHYYDIVAKTGRLSNKFTTYDTFDIDSVIDANYKVWNTTVSIEYGYTKQLKLGYYVKPQAQMTYSRINGVNYQASNETHITQTGVNSLVLRLGASVGRSLDNVNYYFAANVLHEFTAKDKVVTGKHTYASTQERSFKGSRLELSLGGDVKVGKNSNIYLETSKSFGGKVVNKWKAQVGLRFSF